MQKNYQTSYKKAKKKKMSTFQNTMGGVRMQDAN